MIETLAVIESGHFTAGLAQFLLKEEPRKP
jgi:hypothetical protein